MDPIAELLDGLRKNGKPPISWAVKWSNCGQDPVQTAWQRSSDPVAMARLMGWHAGRNDRLRQFAVQIKGYKEPKSWLLRLGPGTKHPRRSCDNDDVYHFRFSEEPERSILPKVAQLIRRLVKTVPTLQELLDAWNRPYR